MKRAELKREVERGSTFTLTSDLSCIAFILFAHVKFTRHWKSTLMGSFFWKCGVIAFSLRTLRPSGEVYDW